MSRKTRQAEKNKGERERLRLKKEQARAETEKLVEIKQERAEEERVDSGQWEADGGEESLDKSYYPEEAMTMTPSPTSFDELDALREASEKAEHVREVTWDVQDLVRNILHDAELEPTEKADRIMDVADEFASRVNSMMDEEADEMEKDLDVLQIEAILSSYKRHTTLFEKGRDWAEDLLKRELSSKARKRLEDSDFALPSKRKYPIHDKSHVRNALARAAQQIKGGGEGAADAKAALPKIRAAAKRMGIEMGMEKSAFLIEKDQAGDWRWVGKPSNNFIDWQNDIISKQAHEKYAAWWELNKDLSPVFVTWHTPGTARENPVDMVLEHEGALIMSGKLTEGEARSLLKQQAKYDLGMSLQGFGMRNDPDKRVISDYWLYEVSDLPLEKAANPFTAIETMTKEADMNDLDKVKYLAGYMGSEEKAKAFLEKTGQVQQQLKEAGITSKEVVEPQAEPPKVEAEPQKAEAPAMDMNTVTQQLIAAVGKEYDMEGLSETLAKVQENLEKIPLLESVIRELQKEREDELAEILTPPVAKFSWSMGNRPSTSEDNKLTKDSEEDKKLDKAAPGVPNGYWLSELTNTVPVQE